MTNNFWAGCLGKLAGMLFKTAGNKRVIDSLEPQPAAATSAPSLSLGQTAGNAINNGVKAVGQLGQTAGRMASQAMSRMQPPASVQPPTASAQPQVAKAPLPAAVTPPAAQTRVQQPAAAVPPPILSRQQLWAQEAAKRQQALKAQGSPSGFRP